MISLTNFIKRWNGRYADYDGYYGPQCVDLVEYWIRNCGYPAVWGNAKNLYANAPVKNFLKYKKTLTNVPRPGDIIIWGGSPADPRWGHTDIFVKGGDTLSKIAAKYKTTWQRLVTLNKGKYPTLAKNPNIIQVSWKLRVR